MQPNILFIMCDQLRYDYLGCAGHPSLRTPNIDALARQGVRFDHAYVQSPICGASRMSFYTGRYMRSHGATWNSSPLPVGEWTIGDHLNPLGMRTALCGKSHMTADVDGMKRLGIDPASDAGLRIAECGFEPWDRLDGLHPPQSSKQPSHYNTYLNAAGYPGPDPWEHWANATEGEEGEELSGWLMENCRRPARVAAEDSETAYSTRRAQEFIEAAGDDRWCLHLSYIKPHWPYVAPAPYHALYSGQDVLPANRTQAERDDPHPILRAFQEHRVSRVFARDGVRETVIPAYMGLTTQIDDEIGRLMAWLKGSGRDRDTVIVFTSDHGDYLGDHWLGEKELFHDASVRIPLIIVDPSPRADATRGMVREELVESIDLLPTFVELAGGHVPHHILEGHSLLPLLHDPAPNPLRDAVFCEYDYAFRRARHILGREISGCLLQMVFDGRYKMVWAEGFRPIVFDLVEDPDEVTDLGADEALAPVVSRLKGRLLHWALRHHNRVTRSDCDIAAYAGTEFQAGIRIGFWDGHDLDEATAKGDGGN